jgi:hypothetical protein
MAQHTPSVMDENEKCVFHLIWSIGFSTNKFPIRLEFIDVKSLLCAQALSYCCSGKKLEGLIKILLPGTLQCLLKQRL